MTILLSVAAFLKIFILMLGILITFKEGFRLLKSIWIKEMFEIEPRALLYLGLSMAYILTCIFI